MSDIISYLIHIYHCFQVVRYESSRIFRDKLASVEDRDKYDSLFENIVENEWLSPVRLSELSSTFFVCESVGRIDASLVEVEPKDWMLMVQAAFKQLGESWICLGCLPGPKLAMEIIA